MFIGGVPVAALGEAEGNDKARHPALCEAADMASYLWCPGDSDQVRYIVQGDSEGQLKRQSHDFEADRKGSCKRQVVL